jgi:hypothetical protein
MNITKPIFALFIAAIAIASCESDDQVAQPTQNGELSASAKEFLAMKLGMAPLTSMSAGSGLGGPVSESFKQLTNARSAAGRMRADTVGGDTTHQDSTEYVSCAEITTKYNKDGSVTTIIDYGDGCEEGYPPYLQFFFGRHEATSYNSFTSDGAAFKNTYFYKNKFVNFGGRYLNNGEEMEWFTDGTASDQGSLEVDSSNNVFNGYFEHQANLTNVWADQSFQHKGSSFTSYTFTQSVVERSDFTFKANDDYYYHVKALKPLITKFNCQQSPDSLGMPSVSGTYVSGIESVHYKINGEEGSFQIDYGDGECDSIITIIEKGKRTVVDLSAPNFVATKD